MSKQIVINDRTREVQKEIDDLTESAVTEFVETAVEIAKQEVPRDTGNLSDSIASNSPRDGTHNIFTQTGYGGFVELGTSRMSAQPYLAPGIDGAINEFNDSRKWS